MIPHRCPVCLGHGNVPGGFYNCVPGGTPTSTNTSEICRSCNGAGVIYCREDEPKYTTPYGGVYPPQNGFYPTKEDEILKVLQELLREVQTIRKYGCPG